MNNNWVAPRPYINSDGAISFGGPPAAAHQRSGGAQESSRRSTAVVARDLGRNHPTGVGLLYATANSGVSTAATTTSATAPPQQPPPPQQPSAEGSDSAYSFDTAEPHTPLPSSTDHRNNRNGGDSSSRPPTAATMAARTASALISKLIASQRYYATYPSSSGLTALNATADDAPDSTAAAAAPMVKAEEGEGSYPHQQQQQQQRPKGGALFPPLPDEVLSPDALALMLSIASLEADRQQFRAIARTERSNAEALVREAMGRCGGGPALEAALANAEKGTANGGRAAKDDVIDVDGTDCVADSGDETAAAAAAAAGEDDDADVAVVGLDASAVAACDPVAMMAFFSPFAPSQPSHANSHAPTHRFSSRGTTSASASAAASPTAGPMRGRTRVDAVVADCGVAIERIRSLTAMEAELRTLNATLNATAGAPPSDAPTAIPTDDADEHGDTTTVNGTSFAAAAVRMRASLATLCARIGDYGSSNADVVSCDQTAVRSAAARAQSFAAARFETVVRRRAALESEAAAAIDVAQTRLAALVGAKRRELVIKMNALSHVDDYDPSFSVLIGGSEGLVADLATMAETLGRFRGLATDLAAVALRLDGATDDRDEGEGEGAAAAAGAADGGGAAVAAVKSEGGAPLSPTPPVASSFSSSSSSMGVVAALQHLVASKRHGSVGLPAALLRHIRAFDALTAEVRMAERQWQSFMDGGAAPPPLPPPADPSAATVPSDAAGSPTRRASTAATHSRYALGDAMGSPGANNGSSGALPSSFLSSSPRGGIVRKRGRSSSADGSPLSGGGLKPQLAAEPAAAAAAREASGLAVGAVAGVSNPTTVAASPSTTVAAIAPDLDDGRSRKRVLGAVVLRVVPATAGEEGRGNASDITHRRNRRSDTNIVNSSDSSSCSEEEEERGDANAAAAARVSHTNKNTNGGGMGGGILRAIGRLWSAPSALSALADEDEDADEGEGNADEGGDEQFAPSAYDDDERPRQRRRAE